MMFRGNKNKSTNLSTQVKKVIGYRILICFLLALIVIIVISISDTISSSRQLQNRLAIKCKNLQNYVISQLLVQNEEAIEPKLNTMNQANPAEKIIWNTHSPQQFQEQLTWSFPFFWKYTYPVTNIDGNSVGSFIVTGSLLSDQQLLFALATKIGLLLLFFIIIVIVLYPLGTRIPKQLFITPINNLLSLLRNEDQTQRPQLPKTTAEEIRETINKVSQLLADAAARSRAAALGQIATQVAHDIRSPLTVLNIETKKLSGVPEINRININNAIKRVNDIANNLLSIYQREHQQEKHKPKNPHECAALLIDSIATEKSIQIANSSIELTVAIAAGAEQLFVEVEPIAFKRVFSNLIDNAIESITGQGQITVTLQKKQENASICIKDTGCGIPAERLASVLDEGVSFGKNHGSGLGLSYAVRKITSWHGKYQLTSTANVGTCFEILLPITPTPVWFATEVLLPPRGNIIILDDDQYIHHLWGKRYKELSATVSIRHFYTPDEVSDYCDTHDTHHDVFLLDYEILGAKITGLMLAEKLEINNQTVLVTNRYEDLTLHQQCSESGIKMLPKPLAKLIPIRHINVANVVLIDDDELITNLWLQAASTVNKVISVFNSPCEFMKLSHYFSKETVIYIDSSLGNKMRGEDYAKLLYEDGYQNIFLATGYPKEQFNDAYWLKGIVGKAPPF